MLPSPAATPSLRNDLAAILSDARVSSDDADRVAYARDLWPRQQILTRMGVAAISPPAVVVWPDDAEEVAAVVRYAAERGVPVVPYGAGSGVCGGILPEPGAIVMDLKRMRRIVRLDAERLECVAGAGMIGQHLEDALGARGFTLGHFPSSIYCSTLGGWIAGRSAGQCSGRYGKIEDMVLGLTCVDGRGRIRHAARDGEDPALLPLVIGSEGILGVVTEATLRIAPAPPCRRFSSWLFDTTADGLEAIREIYQSGLRPAVARLYDPFDSMLARRGGLRTEREHAKRAPSARGRALKNLALQGLVRALRSPEGLNALIEHTPDRAMGGAKLVLVWEADPDLADAELLRAIEICEGLGARDTGEGPARHWLEHRHSVSYRQSPMLAAGAFIDTMEVAATWSRLLPMYHAVREALSPHVFVMAHFSHAYPDGASIYFTFAGAAKDDTEALEKYDRTWKAALRAVIEAGGTLSHHHGVGRSKAPSMRKEQGAAVDVVRALADTMDPAHILNPGALIPARETMADVPPPNHRTRTRVPTVGNRPLGVDVTSRLVHAEAGATLGAIEALLAEHDLTLDLDPALHARTLGAWIDEGMPGARDPDDDPVEGKIAGLELELPDGRHLDLRPAPRRAVGPDIVGAVMGARGALGTVLSAHLVVRSLRNRKTLAFRFADRATAEAARAWMRGLGIRPIRTHVAEVEDGAVLSLVLEGRGRVAHAGADVAQRVAEERGGVPLEVMEATEAIARVPAPGADTDRPVSPIVTELAEQL